MLPLGLMLLSIAVLPLCVPHWWEKNLNKLLVSGVLATLTAIYLLAAGLGGTLVHQVVFDYIPFIILMPRLLGTEGIWLAMPAAEFTTLAIILASSRRRRCQ